MIDVDRLIAPDTLESSEERFDRAIRPKSLADYIGQPVVSHRRFSKALRAHKLGARALHILQVIHIVDNATGVGIFNINAQGDMKIHQDTSPLGASRPKC